MKRNIILGIALVAAIIFATLYGPDVPVKKGLPAQTMKSPVEQLYIIDGEVYYLDKEHRLFKYREEKIIHNFPDENVVWAEETKRFVYPEGEKISDFDLETSGKIWSLDIQADHIYFADREYIFYERNDEYFFWNVREKAEKQLDYDIKYVFDWADGRILYHDSKCDLNVLDYDKWENMVIPALGDETVETSHACLAKDSIYYSRYPDSELKKISLRDGSLERLTNIRVDELALEPLRDGVLILVHKYVDSSPDTALVRADKDGNYERLTEYGKPYYPYNGKTGRLVTDGNIYAYAIAGQNEIVTGKIK